LSFYDSFIDVPPPKPVPIKFEQRSRASGFSIKGDVILKVGDGGVKQMWSRIFATGPMRAEEVIRLESQSFLITPDARAWSFGPMRSTFADGLEEMLRYQNIQKGSRIRIKGTVHVYHRKLVKTEREMRADGSVRIYLNTGYVNFRLVPNTKPQMVEVDCQNLKSVHEHGLELLAADKKTVSHRLLLQPGKQLIVRQNLPYLGRQLQMEPYNVHQLIPRRSEPLGLEIPIVEK
jgi:hypothetical protein